MTELACAVLALGNPPELVTAVRSLLDQSEPVEVTDQMLRLVDIVRPKLVSDGMFLVGLDIVEDKLIEINVFSPGGLGSSSEFAGIDFCDVVIRDLERKVQQRAYYGARMTNIELATL